MKTKQCIKCGEDKPLTREFYPPRKSAKDGYRNDCKVCVNAFKRQWDKTTIANETPEQKQARLDNYKRKRTKYAERRKKNKKDWYEKNAEQEREKARQWSKENRDHINARRRERRKTDPVYHLTENVRSAIRYGLFYHKGRKTNSTWQALPYTPEQLKEHLQAQFDAHMTWDNYGDYWHIDHIHPQSLLPYDSLEHPNFIKCWSLSNLQPLEAIENIKKSNKLLP